MREVTSLLPVHTLHVMEWTGKTLPVTDSIFIKLAGSQLYDLYRHHINSRLFLTQQPQWLRVSSFTRFLDHTQRRTTVGRTPLDK
jgi:hypothetical protein